MIVFGIETSCDETSVALVEDGKKILGMKTFSHVPSHQKYGGIVPEITSRIHVNILHTLVSSLLIETQQFPSNIDLIAVTTRPGLIGSLLIGTSFANALAFSWNKWTDSNYK